MNIAPDQEITRLVASTSRRLGIGTLILSVLALILAFTGYDTPRAVNLFQLLVGVNLFLLGRLCLSMGKAFAKAAPDSIPESLVTALELTNRFFNYLLFLIALAIIGVGFDTVVFLNKILTRISGG